MQASELKDLVKKYFNLTEAPESVEGIVIKKNKEAFAEIKTADGSVTLMYDGELGVGTVLSIHDAEGNVIPAPAGEHLLENGERVVLDENGAVTEFLTPTEAPAETMEEEMMPEEEAPMTEDLMPALIEAVVEAVQDEMKKYGERMSAVESKLETLSAAPAATKTLPKKNNPLVKKQEEIAAPLQAERFNRIMEMAAKRK